MRFLVGAACAVSCVAVARTPQENFVELQALRYTLTTTTLKETRAAGGDDKNTLKESGLATFPNRVTFVGHANNFALQLTRSFNTGGSSYVALGYVLSDFLELGLGGNLYYASSDKLTSRNVKYKEKNTGFFVGPYVLLNLPTDLAELEVRWELDYGLSSQEVAGTKRSDAKGFESDLDARFVFRLSNRVGLTTGVNVFYKAVTDSAPSSPYIDDAGKSQIYSKTSRSDVVIGANILGARFSF